MTPSRFGGHGWRGAVYLLVSCAVELGWWRACLPVVCRGLVGSEREYRHRPFGCDGSSLRVIIAKKDYGQLTGGGGQRPDKMRMNEERCA